METGQSASEAMECLDICSFFLLLLLCVICSTKLHLTEVDIYKPSASGAIKTWLISRVLCSILIVCVLKAIGRRQDSCVSLCETRESARGRSSMWGKWRFKGNIRRRSCLLHKEPPSASIKEVNIVLKKKRTHLQSHCLEYKKASWIYSRETFLGGKRESGAFFFQVNLFPCIIIPINKLFYSYSTTDISV